MYLRLISRLRNNFINVPYLTRISIRTLATEQKNSEIKDEPVKYSTSDAGKWKAKYTIRGEDYDYYPKSQPLVLMISLTCFMVYFFILREENDWDDMLRENERLVPLKLEEMRLKQLIENGKRKHLNTAHLEDQLAELEKLKQK